MPDGVNRRTLSGSLGDAMLRSIRRARLAFLRFRLAWIEDDLSFYARFLKLGRKEPETYLALHRKKHALVKSIQALE